MFVVQLDDSTADDTALVGAKGANLARMVAAGVPVPGGFCVTTAAYRALVNDPAIQHSIRALAELDPEDADAVQSAGAAVRARIEARSWPEDAARALTSAVAACGAEHGYAVRSSATAEDLPEASFAGQQDTYLNVRGTEAIMNRVRACMASLFTDRAIVYRARHGIPHTGVAAAVVVQRMVEPRASGILSTADPVTGNRSVASIDAGFGLGEALVSGAITADLIRVARQTGRVEEYRVGHKRVAVRLSAHGGTETVELPPDRQRARVLDDQEVRTLVHLGLRIEALFLQPQDIEWCLEEDRFTVVQSRPITSLFPLPLPQPTDRSVHVYYSWGHKEAMPEAMPPLVTDLWRRMLVLGPPRKNPSPSPWAAEAGGRVYMDLTPFLQRPWVRARVLDSIASVDEPAVAALRAFFARDTPYSGPRMGITKIGNLRPRVISRVMAALLLEDTRGLAEREMAWYTRYVDEAIERMRAHSDPGQRARAAVDELYRASHDMITRFYPFFAVTLAERALRRLCPNRSREIDAVGKGLKGDVITQMTLKLGDVADVARANPEVVEALQARKGLDEIFAVPGGPAFCRALDIFLAQYGSRGYAEIDISRPRWGEDASQLLQIIRGNLERGIKGEHHAHVRELMLQARRSAHRLERRARRGVWGATRSALVRRFIHVMRAYMAIREHPKHALARMLAEARVQLLAAGQALARDGRLATADDVWFVTVDELLAALEHPGEPVDAPVAERRAAFERHAGMTAPRVVTSEGEAITAAILRADAPEGALVGTAVSSGVVEGIAHVVHDPRGVTIEKGEIVVGPFCDPGWTPLFLNASGMVMEVGGLMTHGSLVAREYGIPAVVSVDSATQRIRTGQRVRVDGWSGYVEILES